MSTITAKQVQALRERTGAGFMECKKALTAAKGDIEAAIEAMRKAGQAKADKKADRIAADGLITIDITNDHRTAAMVETNCETDFVARDEAFKQFTHAVTTQALTTKINNVSDLLATTLTDGGTLEQARQALIAKIGENIQVRRIVVLQSQHQLAAYIHNGRIGVLVELQGGDAQVGKDLAMHIAASNPLVITPNQVPAELITREKEIFSAQAQNSGKPTAIIEKMIEGRLRKFLDEVSLLGQPFVKNPEQTVQQLLQQTNAKVLQFARFAVGEGIEKQTENFVEAVMAQVHGN